MKVRKPNRSNVIFFQTDGREMQGWNMKRLLDTAEKRMEIFTTLKSDGYARSKASMKSQISDFGKLVSFPTSGYEM